MNYALLLPEIVLFLTLMGLIINEIGYFGERYRIAPLTALVGLLAAFLQNLLLYRWAPTSGFYGVIVIDGLSILFKLFGVGMMLLVAILTMYSQEMSASRKSEFCSLIVSAALFMS